MSSRNSRVRTMTRPLTCPTRLDSTPKPCWLVIRLSLLEDTTMMRRATQVLRHPPANSLSWRRAPPTRSPWESAAHRSARNRVYALDARLAPTGSVSASAPRAGYVEGQTMVLEGRWAEDTPSGSQRLRPTWSVPGWMLLWWAGCRQSRRPWTRRRRFPSSSERDLSHGSPCGGQPGAAWRERPAA